jgi:hypothetical protein
MSERTREKEMDRLRQLAGVLRQAARAATDSGPTAPEKLSATKKLRTASRRSVKEPSPQRKATD